MDLDSYAVARIVDPRTDVEAPRVMLAKQGPASSTWSAFQASAADSLAPQFVITPSSLSTGIARAVYYRATGTITIAGVALEALTESARVALRAFPLQNAQQSVNVSLNDASISIGNISQIVAALARVGMGSKSLADAASVCASAPDLWANYADAVGTPLFDAPAAALYSNYAVGSRTNGITSVVVNEAGTSAVLTFDIVEPCIVSLFSGANSNAYEKALYGISNLIIAPQYSAAAGRMLSIALPDGTTMASQTLAFTSQSVLVNFVVPLDRSTIEIMPAVAYSIANIQAYPTNIPQTLAAGQLSASVSSGVYQLSTVPHKIVIWAGPSDQERTDPTRCLADFFLPISGVQISFGGRSGLLSSAASVDLWNITRRAIGSSAGPFWHWSGARQFTSNSEAAPRAAGGPLVIDVAAELSLPSGLAPGMAVPVTFQLTAANFLNHTGEQMVQPRLWCMFLTEGVAVNHSGSTGISYGGVPGSHVEEFPRLEEATAADVAEFAADGGFNFGGLLGGSKFGHFFRKLFKGATGLAKQAAKVAGPALASALKTAAQHPELMAAGRGGALMPAHMYRRS